MEWVLLIGIIWFIAFISENIPDRKKTNRYDDDKSKEQSRLLREIEESIIARSLDQLDIDKKESKTLEEELEEIFGYAESHAREKINANELFEQKKDNTKTENPIHHPLPKCQYGIEKKQPLPNQQLKNSISKRAEERGITHLVHFTRVENLGSIFRHGLRSINYLKTHNLSYDYNDEYRFDQRLDGVSLSVMHPNSLMFYKYRKQGKPGAWAILLLDIEVLDRDCLFFKGNAASNNERFKSADELRGFESFEQMFEGSNFSHAPTDVQAEVMCMEPIPPNLIKTVVFQNSYEERTAKALQLPVPTSVNRNLFERSPSQGVN